MCAVIKFRRAPRIEYIHLNVIPRGTSCKTHILMQLQGVSLVKHMCSDEAPKGAPCKIHVWQNCPHCAHRGQASRGRGTIIDTQDQKSIRIDTPTKDTEGPQQIRIDMQNGYAHAKSQLHINQIRKARFHYGSTSECIVSITTLEIDTFAKTQ